MQIVGTPIVAIGVNFGTFFDDPQHLEQEEEVPVGPRDVGRGRRVGLGPELGAEHAARATMITNITISAMIESLATA